jgi:hypothetical protein
LVVSGAEQKARGTPEKNSMLVLDAFKGYLTPEILATITGSCVNTDLVVVSEGMTSQLQVLAVVNKLFNDHLKLLYSAWLMTGNNALIPAGIINKQSMTCLCQWIITAWHSI